MGRAYVNVRYLSDDASFLVMIHLGKQRLICQECGKSSMPQFPLVDRHCCIANQVKRFCPAYAMKITYLTFKRNLTDLLNAAKYSQSNGCLEGVNRKIKQIERTAFGYCNFSHLVARIKLEEAETVVKEKSTKLPSSLMLKINY